MNLLTHSPAHTVLAWNVFSHSSQSFGIPFLFLSSRSLPAFLSKLLLKRTISNWHLVPQRLRISSLGNIALYKYVFYIDWLINWLIDEWLADQRRHCPALCSAGIATSKEPTGLTTVDGKHPPPSRPDFYFNTLKYGKHLTWYITVLSAFAPSYFLASSYRESGAAEVAIPHEKRLNNPVLHRVFFSSQLRSKLWASWIHLHLIFRVSWVGGWVLQLHGDVRETAFLFQRLSVVIQRYNSVLIHESSGDLDIEPHASSYSSYFGFSVCFSPSVFIP